VTGPAVTKVGVTGPAVTEASGVTGPAVTKGGVIEASGVTGPAVTKGGVTEASGVTGQAVTTKCSGENMVVVDGLRAASVDDEEFKVRTGKFTIRKGKIVFVSSGNRRPLQNITTGEQSSSTLYSKTFAKALTSVGLGIKLIKADGNCVFRAISFLLFGTEDHHYFVRSLSIRFMIRNAYFFSNNVEFDGSLLSYIHKMSCSSTWGGEMELWALTGILKMNISVYRASYHDDESFEVENHVWPPTLATFATPRKDTLVDTHKKTDPSPQVLQLS
jgi:hypothetical protein